MGFLERNFHNPTEIYDIRICGNSIYVYSLQKHISEITKLLFALSWKKERNERILRIQKTQKWELNKIQIWWTQINIINLNSHDSIKLAKTLKIIDIFLTSVLSQRNLSRPVRVGKIWCMSALCTISVPKILLKDRKYPFRNL